MVTRRAGGPQRRVRPRRCPCAQSQPGGTRWEAQDAMGASVAGRLDGGL